jgi:hypothetical protein
LLYRAWLEWRVFARAALKAASIAWAWTAAQSAAVAHKLQRLLFRAWLEWRVFARGAFNLASVESSRAAKRSRILARAARKSAVAGSSRAWAKTGSLAQASLDGLVFVGTKTERLFDKRPASTQANWAWARPSSLARASLDGLIFLGAKTERLFDKRVILPAEPVESAQVAINGHCTALVCIEPWRAKLPVLRESLAIPGLSWQLPPRPEARPPA